MAAKSVSLYFFDNGNGNGNSCVHHELPHFDVDGYSDSGQDICSDGLALFGLKPEMLELRKVIRVNMTIDSVERGEHSFTFKKLSAPKKRQTTKRRK